MTAMIGSTQIIYVMCGHSFQWSGVAPVIAWRCGPCSNIYEIKQMVQRIEHVVGARPMNLMTVGPCKFPSERYGCLRSLDTGECLCSGPSKEIM